MSTLYEKMRANQASESKIGPFNNETEMMKQFNAYKKTFRGNPQTAQQQVLSLIRSGKVSPQMLQYAGSLANKFFGK